MKIRKKLFLSHLCVIFIPILLAVVVGVGLFRVYGYKYWDSVEEMLGDLNRSDLVEWTVYECAEQYSFGDWDDEEEADEGIAAYSRGDDRIWEYLSSQLSDMGYRSEIKVAGVVVFDSLNQEDKESVTAYLGSNNSEIKYRTVGSGRTVVVRTTFEEGAEMIEVTAVSDTAWRTVLYIVLYFVFVLASIIVTNILLLRWLGKSIMIPLNELRRCTHNISQGDLDSAVTYSKPDEFGEVCRDFESMRLHLKDSVETQARYESERQDMLSGISHDLRTPLTSIKGYAEGLQESIANTEEKRKRYYHAIHVCALEIENLLDDLSTFSRLENKSYKYKLEAVDMNEFIARLIENRKEDLSRKNAAVTFENQADNAVANINKQEMQRVFINLFENSIKYKTKESCAIHVATKSENDSLVILVADDGQGVPDEDLENIFHIFYRGDSARTKTENGSGIGLAIVKRVIEGHNGTVQAYNDNGLVVKITLPTV